MENRKVLIVDDDRDFAEAVKVAFESQSFSVVIASDGNQGVEAAKKQAPDVIVLDVMMPKKDGYAALFDLKQNRVTEKIPVLMLTSLGDKEAGKIAPELLAKGHGAEAYMEKPVEPDVLIQKANELIATSTQKAEDASMPKILIVDDDYDFADAVKTILEEEGYRTSMVLKGEEGLDAAKKENPDLVLLDVMLPGKDGYTICKELKTDSKTRAIPVIMLTSVAKLMNEPEYAKAMAVTHEADDYLEKPVEPKELVQRIQNLIGPKRRLM